MQSVSQTSKSSVHDFGSEDLFRNLDQALKSELSQDEAEKVSTFAREHFPAWVQSAKKSCYHVHMARKEETKLPYTIRVYTTPEKAPRMHVVLDELEWSLRKVVKKVLVVTPTTFSSVAEIGINVRPHDDDHLDKKEIRQHQKGVDVEASLIRRLSQRVSSFLAYTKVKVLRRNGRCRYKYHTDLAETDLYNLIISNRTVLPFNEKINIIAQVAAKLKDLHKNGICHLAIIPSNVLRFKDGRVQLCGYGDATGIGKRVKLQGEQGYVAPEIFQKEKPAVNPKLDMWSLGSLMYELLSDGDCAFRGAIEEFPEENPDTLLRRKQNTEARAKELCSKLSERSKADPQHETIYRLAARCIDADPEKRPTAEEVLQILKTLEETP